MPITDSRQSPSADPSLCIFPSGRNNGVLIIQVDAARASGSAAARRLKDSSPMAAANVNVQVTNGVTSEVQSVGNTVTSYSFRTPDGYSCRSDASMKWSCTLNGVPVLEIPVVLIPLISECRKGVFRFEKMPRFR